MLNSRVHQAVLAALALGSAAAANAAVDITGVPAANVLYISGSTAIDPGLTSYYTAGATAPCSSAATDPTPSFYTSTVANQKFVAVACVGNETATGFAGVQIAIIKEDNGGSQFGIDPVRDNQGLGLAGQTVVNFFPNFQTMSAANCPANASGVLICGSSVTTSTVHPNLGFADVDPGMFGETLTSALGSATQFNSLDVIFAPAVSLGLYHELQSLEGTGSGDLAANMPQLTKSQLAELFSGAITNWNKLFPTIGSTAVTWGTSGGTQFSTAATNPRTTAVILCRRGESSGTQREAEIFFENQNCASGVNLIAGPTQSSCSTDGCTWGTSFQGNVVFAGAGTGDVLSCLQAHDKLGHLALGIASIDNPWGSFQGNTARQDFRYVRYNDAVPSIETASAGAYNYWAQSVGIAPGASNGNVPSGVAGAISTFMQTGADRVGSVASIANLNATHVYEAGNWDAGFLAIPEAAASITPNAATGVTVSQFEANPVNTDSKFGVGAATNNCVPAHQDSTAPSSSPAPSWLVPALF